MDELTLEQLKKSWQSTSVSESRLEETAERVRAVAKKKRKSMGIARKMSRDYLRISLLGVIVMLLALPLYYVIEAPLGLCIFYGIFGLIMGSLNAVFGLYIRNIDFMGLPVVQAIDKALLIRRMQWTLLAFGICLGLCLLIPLGMVFWDLPEGRSVFWGGVAGGIIGLAIGISKERKFFRQSRALLRALQAIKAGE
ncbi:MAG: hypothetical protein K2L96_09035 [Muribaculaceae bacterium]|nr:hypothetical protein [Muribaculaceae bacterium]